MSKEIALIGYGRFGRLAAAHLRKDFQVCVVEPRKSVQLARGMRRVSLEEAASKPVVLLSVPINRLCDVLTTIAPKLRIGALVIDVCSVKEQPVRWMKSLLPKDVLILGTHPLFGPDSAAKSLMGHTIVLCPVRIRKRQLQRLSTYLRARGLNVQLLTPLRHDKLMASTLFLTQFVGHGLRKLSLPNPTSSTHNFRSLHHIATITGNDTMELFRDMFEYNRFAKRLPEELLRSFSELHKTLKSPRSY